jgi:6-phosphogluconate dehydrogenase
MQLGIIGLGRMGASIARRLMRAGHQCVVFDIHPQAVADLARDGAMALGRSRTSPRGSPRRAPSG